MTTRMVHPLHGATHAYDSGEVERLKVHGWEVEAGKGNKLIPAAELSAHLAPFVEQFNTAVQAVPERKKPGPKPKAK